MSYYSKHVFFCTNDRQDGQPCCQRFNTRAMRKYVKDKCKKLGIHDAGKIRINSAGCMGRCNEGPIIVIYPDGIWYTFVDEEDLDEIVEQHLLKGKIVKRLQLPAIV
ncbi:MAG: NAD(P)H-dependent oxidoreductase subunit E [gamma proteobacterium symbiont of Taylorina sp.]|nr:NAD(P)H-dependent oxidoreductase subunit E [gamma proteobacterium symbiont of Taylorina sp.]